VPVGVPRGALRGASPALFRLASDNQLVRGVRAGRQAAFEVVYDRYHRPILSFCSQLLGDRYEAEDAVQHTFMAAYDSLLDHDRPIQLKPWLFAIARNRCYTVLRARREIASAEMVEGEGENPANIVQRREDLRDLVFDVSRLPDDQRAALVMAELGALSHDEIALALEVPREKVKALVFQARESLLATRTARETDCAQIREELSAVRGPAMRRSHLRRHLHACEGCREYRSQLRHQRARLAALIPVVPSVALKQTVLQGTVGARTASAGAGGGTAAAAGSSALKLALVKPIAVAILSVAGAAAVVHTALHHPRRPVVSAARTPLLIAHSRHVAHVALRPDGVQAKPPVRVSYLRHGPVSHRTVRHPLWSLPVARPVPVRQPAPSHQAPPVVAPVPVSSSAPTPAPASSPAPAAEPALPVASHEAQDRPTVTTPTGTHSTDGGPSTPGSGDGTGSTGGTTAGPSCTDRPRKRHHRHHHIAGCPSAVPKPTGPTAPGATTPVPTTAPATTAPLTATTPMATGATGTAVPAPTGDPTATTTTSQPHR